jgi:hypothetical protein
MTVHSVYKGAKVLFCGKPYIILTCELIGESMIYTLDLVYISICGLLTRDTRDVPKRLWETIHIFVNYSLVLTGRSHIVRMSIGFMLKF